jgi:hypothetical protein
MIIYPLLPPVGLLGGEAHPDACNGETRLFARIEQILSLAPDAICTDYPEHCAKMRWGSREGPGRQ